MQFLTLRLCKSFYHIIGLLKTTALDNVYTLRLLFRPSNPSMSRDGVAERRIAVEARSFPVLENNARLGKYSAAFVKQRHSVAPRTRSGDAGGRRMGAIR